MLQVGQLTPFRINNPHLDLGIRPNPHEDDQGLSPSIQVLATVSSVCIDAVRYSEAKSSVDAARLSLAEHYLQVTTMWH